MAIFDDELDELLKRAMDRFDDDVIGDAFARALRASCRHAVPLPQATLDILGLENSDGKESIRRTRFVPR
jgi:hypothetical protein